MLENIHGYINNLVQFALVQLSPTAVFFQSLVKLS